MITRYNLYRPPSNRLFSKYQGYSPQNEDINFDVDSGHIPSDEAYGNGFTYIKGYSRTIFLNVGYIF